MLKTDSSLALVRDCLPGGHSCLEILSHTSVGQKHSERTYAEVSSAGAYFYNLADNMPDWWGYPEDMVLDIPGQFRSIYQFRTTLGHKANHLFVGNNTEYSRWTILYMGDSVPASFSPFTGRVEDYVDYWYEVTHDTEPWYRQLYYQTVEEEKTEFGDFV